MVQREPRSSLLRRGRLVGLTAASLASLLPASLAAPVLATADPCSAPDANRVVTCVFNPIGAPQYWVIPDNITAATFEVDGAQGESESSFLRGGFGALITGTFDIGPNEVGKTLRLDVGATGVNGVGGYGGGGDGGTGANGQNLGSGGGGGASRVSIEQPNGDIVDYVVAGGGGGVGDSSLDANGGIGGRAGDAGQRGQNIPNAGGGLAGRGATLFEGGAAGAAGSILDINQGCSSAQGGDTSKPSTPGDLGQGGNGGSTILTLAGGGGGGGVYGGGGGGASWSCDGFPAGGGGGGGGSSFVPDGFTIAAAPSGNSGQGQIVITYTLPAAADTTPPVITPSITGTLGQNGWYRSTVSVSFAISDPESSVTTTCATQTLSTDTTGTTVSCSATSDGGTTPYSATFKIDTTAPSLTPTVTPNPVDLDAVATASPGASDATSGVASSSCATVDTSTVGASTVACTATDNAGNTANANASYVVADTSSPLVVPTITGTEGDNGWYRSAVSISWDVSDPESGVSSTTGCDPVTLSADTASTLVACSASNDTLRTDVQLDIRIDQTAPTLAPTVSPASASVAVGGTITATPHASDATSGVASSSCDAADTTTAGSKTLTCRARDAAGNRTTQSVAYEVTDSSAPDIAYTLDGTSGDNGWYTSNVDIDFTVTDGQSSVTTTCTDRTITSQGSSVTVTCSASSAGGTTPFSLTLKIDKTAPALAPTITPSPLYIGATATASPNATDGTSGVAGSSCATPSTATAGIRSVSCSARDRAGNTSAASVSYTVGYRFLGFQKPPAGSSFKSGSNLPVAFSLGTASGAKLSDALATSLVGSCLVRVSFTGGPLSPDCAAYNPTSDQFTFDLKTQKSLTGNQTITVRVYAGTDVVTSATMVVRMKA